jgi:hypothetical protein
MGEARSMSWSRFDPNLRIEVHPSEYGHTVTATHLPTGLQSSVTSHGTVADNTATAIARLKIRVGD